MKLLKEQDQKQCWARGTEPVGVSPLVCLCCKACIQHLGPKTGQRDEWHAGSRKKFKQLWREYWQRSNLWIRSFGSPEDDSVFEKGTAEKHQSMLPPLSAGFRDKMLAPGTFWFGSTRFPRRHTPVLSVYCFAKGIETDYGSHGSDGSGCYQSSPQSWRGWVWTTGGNSINSWLNLRTSWNCINHRCQVPWVTPLQSGWWGFKKLQECWIKMLTSLLGHPPLHPIRQF